MTQTRLMRADEMAHAFNTVTERQYWRAVVGGSRTHPEVVFNSRSSMVRIAYRIAQSDFTVSYSKTSAAFGDFCASTLRAVAQILAALKAAGYPFNMPLHDKAILRLEYCHEDKVTVARLANLGDDWLDAEPLPFKVPERESAENIIQGVDAESTSP